MGVRDAHSMSVVATVGDESNTVISYLPVCFLSGAVVFVVEVDEVRRIHLGVGWDGLPLSRFGG